MNSIWNNMYKVTFFGHKVKDFAKTEVVIADNVKKAEMAIVSRFNKPTDVTIVSVKDFKVS